MSTDADKALELTLAHLDKQYGSNTVQRMGDKSTESWPAVPTGAKNLDIALGIGGLPRGRVIEIYGPESSGKTTLALSVAAMLSAMGLKTAIVDAEHALDPIYAAAVGVDVDNLYIAQPDTAEAALDIADKLTRTGAFALVIVDSVAALTPQAELEGEMTDQHMGLLARIMGKGLRRITPAAANTNTMVIFVNQIREKIGVMFGSPETTPGGRALKFFASVRIDIRKVKVIEDPTGNNEAPGVRTKVKIVKNKMAPPFRQAEFDILYGHGIDNIGILVDMGVDLGIIKKSGAWFSYEGANLGQGRANTIQTLREDLEIAKKVDALIDEHFFGAPVVEETET